MSKMSQQGFGMNERLRAATRDLRSRLGMNQVAFSMRLGVSYGALQKYEQRQAASGVALEKLRDLAREEKHEDLAGLFEIGIALTGFTELSPVDFAKIVANNFLPHYLWTLIGTWWAFVEQMPPERTADMFDRMRNEMGLAPNEQTIVALGSPVDAAPLLLNAGAVKRTKEGVNEKTRPRRRNSLPAKK